jgi:hypothetical protein
MPRLAVGWRYALRLRCSPARPLSWRSPRARAGDDGARSLGLRDHVTTTYRSWARVTINEGVKVTRDANIKRRVRERQARTSEKYTVARRAVEAELGPELHYLFTAPRTIERIHGSERHELGVPPPAGPAFAWGYGGSGPNTSAWAVLGDATGDCDNRLAIEFVDDNLGWPELAEEPFVITAAEVRAWRAEREPRIRSAPPIQIYTGRELAELVFEHLQDADGIERPWFELYRTRRRAPRIS